MALLVEAAGGKESICMDENTRTESLESDESVTDDMLVEEVSIDGMCGVY